MAMLVDTMTTEPADPLARLRNRLQELHLQRGEPSTRDLARRTHNGISHTTVNKVLQCVAPPRWGQVELVVEALGGDVEAFRQDWIAVRTAARQASADRGGAGATAGPTLAEVTAELARVRRERDELLARVETRRVYVLEQGRFPSDANSYPTVLRMLIGNELRRLRQARGISREAAGWELRASESKISRMELGRIGFKERDVTDLLNLYGITDATERETLIGLVREANQPGWWEQYNDVMPSWLQSYLGMEEAASLIRTYETLLVPALLQTRRYARAAVELSHPDASAEEVERRVQLLMSRQRLLERDKAHLWAIIDEAVLHRRVGDPGVMQEQLATLARTSTRDNIKIQIVPLDVPVGAGAVGPFTILRFRHPELPDVVYVEQLTSAVYLDQPEGIMRYVMTMDRLAVRAAPPDRTAGILTALVRNVPGGALPAASR